ncbi:MAG: GatB/YqeY domain-containing protein [Gammaproteobacteria bacterium]|nr:MAG: GatB/YqeY domain-containing protein [Gammaproteobacteria bacterium]
MPESLKAQITEAMKAALKAGDKARLSTVRLILADIKRVEVDERRELSDADTLAILAKMLKQRRDAASQFQQAQRTDLADKELAEITVIESFMPAGLSDSEIDAQIEEAITAAAASSARDMGKVMAILKERLAGRADMTAVSARVKARLNR